MRRFLATVSIAALLAASTLPAWPQETTEGPAAHPVPIVHGQSATPSGGISSGGAPTEAPAPSPAPPPASIPPGPPAGPQQAEYLSNGPLIAGAIAATAIVVCAITCFGHSSSTTTSTNVQHH